MDNAKVIASATAKIHISRTHAAKGQHLKHHEFRNCHEKERLWVYEIQELTEKSYGLGKLVISST